MISTGTTVAQLLDEHPGLVETLAAYHPHFRQLRNRLLRKVMAPRITVAQAARMAGVPPAELLSVLRRAAGEAEPAGEGPVVEPGGNAAPRPALLDSIPESRRVHVDVREDIRRGQEPFARIMGAVKALGPRDVLVLRAPFEPLPLYDVLGKRGFAHWTESLAPDDWSVWFYRDERPAADSPGGAGTEDAWPRAPAIVIDVRGLEPPQPMVRVLEQLDRLQPGQQLEVIHDRRPLFLYPQLDDRGFIHQTEEAEPGRVRIVIRHGPRT